MKEIEKEKVEILEREEKLRESHIEIENRLKRRDDYYYQVES